MKKKKEEKERILNMEFLRQLEVFDPEKYSNKRIEVIGVGAVGSYIVWFLTKVGFTNIHIRDHDYVEKVNLPNQCLLLEHYHERQKLPKVMAVADMVKRGSGITLNTNQKEVVGPEKFGEIVFLAVDKMTVRKKIWEESLKYKLPVRCVIEARMGGDQGRVYTINPCKPSHIDNWEKSLCLDEEAEVSLCGSSISIATTAALIADIAVWQLQKWVSGQEVENEVIISTRPWAIISRTF